MYLSAVTFFLNYHIQILKFSFASRLGLKSLFSLVWVGPQKLDIIWYRWVGRSKKGPKNWISFMDGPLEQSILFRFFMSRYYQTCPNWFKQVQTCSKWILPVKIWINLSKIDQTCLKLINMSEINQTYPKWIKLVWFCQNWFKPVQTCPNWFNHVETFTK